LKKRNVNNPMFFKFRKKRNILEENRNVTEICRFLSPGILSSWANDEFQQFVICTIFWVIYFRNVGKHIFPQIITTTQHHIRGLTSLSWIRWMIDETFHIRQIVNVHSRNISLRSHTKMNESMTDMYIFRSFTPSR
jgi:hypothetical protein